MSDSTNSFIAQPATVTDSRGRRIVVRKMHGGTRGRAILACGKEANEYFIGMGVLAAACAQIDERPVAFPRNPNDINNILDLLGDDGMEAIANSFGDVDNAQIAAEAKN